MVRSIVAASLAALSFASVSQAQDFTFSGGYDRADFDGVEFDTIVLRGRYMFNERFGAEGQLNFGINDESVDLGVVTADVSLDYGVGAFAFANLYTNEGLNLFGRLGYVHAELEADAVGITVSEDDGAFAAGVGAEFFFDDRNGVRFDYTWADYEDSANFYGLSYVRRFGG
ncbi:MAG: porin family protein [Maricaulis sp.]|uniref:porin family protein n=1 Tax=Maricaulis sp. TaxID=1486257 RepID=UPI002619A747|nr:porin family protein [Maricaulis sp.]MDM7985644.1 porin family protein [Maricaulis sp.]